MDTSNEAGQPPALDEWAVVQVSLSLNAATQRPVVTLNLPSAGCRHEHALTTEQAVLLRSQLNWYLGT